MTKTYDKRSLHATILDVIWGGQQVPGISNSFISITWAGQTDSDFARNAKPYLCTPFMTTVKILILQLISLATLGQDSTKQIQFSQIDWKLIVPTITNIRSSITQDTIIQISTTYIKERLNIEKNDYNSCLIKVKPSEPDSLKAMPDAEAWNQSKKTIALTYSQQESVVKFIDSVSSFEIIDGVRFDIFFYKIKLAKYPTFNIYILHATNNLHDINIYISYDDSNIDLGNQFLEIVRRSKFGRDKNKL